MVIKKDRCHECGTEIADGEYYCYSCQLQFAKDLNGLSEEYYTEERWRLKSMNKGDIDEIIKLFARYCEEPLEFGAIHSIDNTGMVLKYTIEIKQVEG